MERSDRQHPQASELAQLVRDLIGRNDLGTMVSLPFEGILEALCCAQAHTVQDFALALRMTPADKKPAERLPGHQALLARMAGNIASGMASKLPIEGLQDHGIQQSIAAAALGIARAIVRELRENPGP